MKNAGISNKKETDFHEKLDKLMHKTFGVSPSEKKDKQMKEGTKMIGFKAYLIGDDTTDSELQTYIEALNSFNLDDSSLTESVVGEYGDRAIIKSDAEGNVGDPHKVYKKVLMPKDTVSSLHDHIKRVSSVYGATVAPSGTEATDNRNSKIAKDILKRHTGADGVLNRGSLKKAIGEAHKRLSSAGIDHNSLSQSSVKRDSVEKDSTPSERGEVTTPSLKLPGVGTVVAHDESGTGDEKKIKHTVQTLCPGATDSCGGRTVDVAGHCDVKDPKTGKCFAQNPMSQYSDVSKARHRTANILLTKQKDHVHDGGTKTGPHVAEDAIHAMIGAHLHTLESAEKASSKAAKEGRRPIDVSGRANTTSEGTGKLEGAISGVYAHAKKTHADGDGPKFNTVRYGSTSKLLPGEKRSDLTMSDKGPNTIKNPVTGEHREVEEKVKRSHDIHKHMSDGGNSYVIADANRKYNESEQVKSMKGIKAICHWRRLDEPKSSSDGEYKKDHAFHKKLSKGMKPTETRWFDHDGNSVEDSKDANHGVHVDSSGTIHAAQMTHRIPPRKAADGTPTDDRNHDNHHVDKMLARAKKINSGGHTEDHNDIGVDGGKMTADSGNHPLSDKHYTNPVTKEKMGSTYTATKIGPATSENEGVMRHGDGKENIAHPVNSNTDRHGVWHLNAPFDVKTGESKKVVGKYTGAHAEAAENTYNEAGRTASGMKARIKKSIKNGEDPFSPKAHPVDISGLKRKSTVAESVELKEGISEISEAVKWLSK